MKKHLRITITDTTLAVTRNQARIDAEAALDGIYVLRASVPATDLDAAAVISAYKNSPRSNATSAASKPTTWTCAPSITASRTASAPMS